MCFDSCQPHWQEDAIFSTGADTLLRHDKVASSLGRWGIIIQLVREGPRNPWGDLSGPSFFRLLVSPFVLHDACKCLRIVQDACQHLRVIEVACRSRRTMQDTCVHLRIIQVARRSRVVTPVCPTENTFQGLPVLQESKHNRDKRVGSLGS